MQQYELILAIIFFVIAVICISIVIIAKIRSQRSLLGIEDKDFIEKAVEKKKRSLNSNLGAMSFKTYISLLIGLPIVVGVVCWFLMPNKSLAVFMGLISIAGPDLYIKATGDKQAKLFEEKYARALKALAACLRSNMTIQQAVEEVANHNVFIDGAIQKGFRQIESDIKVGLSVQQAFQRFADESGNVDAQDVASAIAMQGEVGGSEARIIETINSNIQDRIMSRKEIKTLFAETSVMVTAMDVIPIIIIFVLYFGAPQFIVPYFESAPLTIVFFILISVMLLGSFFIRKKLNKSKGGN